MQLYKNDELVDGEWRFDIVTEPGQYSDAYPKIAKLDNNAYLMPMNYYEHNLENGYDCCLTLRNSNGNIVFV